MNGAAALVIAAYLGAVLWRGRMNDLMMMLAQEGGFLKWFFALLILLWLRKVPGLHEVASGLLTLALVALALNAGGRILPNLAPLITTKPLTV